MPASQAQIGYGTLLQRGNGAAPEVFTTIAEVTSVDFAGPNVKTEDATNMGSPGGYMESIPTLIDPGEATIALHFLQADAGQKALLADCKAKVLRNFQCVWPNGAVRAFAAYVTNFPIKGPVDKIMDVTLKLKISGPITDPA